MTDHEAERPEAPPQEEPIDDDAIRTLVTRLSRPHRSGGVVVERAALQAEGADLTAVLAWITEQGGRAEDAAPKRGGGGGLHGARGSSSLSGRDPVPLRFILPPGALRAAAGTPTTKEPS